jgi:predicted nucleic acid-binding protein
MRFTIDTSVFISALSETEEAHEASRAFLQALVGKPVIVILPTLISPEISGAVSRLSQNLDLAANSLRVLELLPNLNLIPLDEQLAGRAAIIAREGGMKGSDAVFVTVAETFDSVLVSLDRQQRLRSPSAVRALTPGEALSEVARVRGLPDDQ